MNRMMMRRAIKVKRLEKEKENKEV